MKVWETYGTGPETSPEERQYGEQWRSRPEVVIGSGTPWLPADLRLDLRLVDVHRFGRGVVHLAYEL